MACSNRPHGCQTGLLVEQIEQEEYAKLDALNILETILSQIMPIIVPEVIDVGCEAMEDNETNVKDDVVKKYISFYLFMLNVNQLAKCQVYE